MRIEYSSALPLTAPIKIGLLISERRGTMTYTDSLQSLSNGHTLPEIALPFLIRVVENTAKSIRPKRSKLHLSPLISVGHFRGALASSSRMRWVWNATQTYTSRFEQIRLDNHANHNFCHRISVQASNSQSISGIAEGERCRHHWQGATFHRHSSSNSTCLSSYFVRS